MFRKCMILALVFSAALLAAAQQFSDWNIATNVGSVNSPATETDPFISKDGLSLYFACADCPGGGGIYVSHRDTMNDPWRTPFNLTPLIGPGTRPLLSSDEHRLYFTSSRGGGYGGDDIWVARRRDRRDDYGWRAPENLGAGVNSTAQESTGSLFEDDSTGVITLYFDSDRLVSGVFHIFASTLQEDETFGPAAFVQELNSPFDQPLANDRRPMVRRDGLEIFLLSNRSGSIRNLKGQPSFDLWTSTRVSTSAPWSTPVNLDPLGTKYINTPRHDGGPALSFDGTTLYFHAAQRTDNVGPNCADPAKPAFASCFFDLWVTTREKLLGHEKRESDPH